MADGGRSVERHHQEVEVDGERVHRHHLDGQRADQSGGRRGEQLVVGEPGTVGLEVPLDAEVLPSSQLGDQLVGGGLRLKTERVAGEVGARCVRPTTRRYVEQVAMARIRLVTPQSFVLIGRRHGCSRPERKNPIARSIASGSGGMSARGNRNVDRLNRSVNTRACFADSSR